MLTVDFKQTNKEIALTLYLGVKSFWAETAQNEFGWSVNSSNIVAFYQTVDNKRETVQLSLISTFKITERKDSNCCLLMSFMKKSPHLTQSPR